jgi:pyruvate dehydrogenase E2 component (dihydrolipoamide acetyltransferase)
MISEVVMPQMGADMKEGTLLRWIKSEGEQINRGDVIAEIETDKANIEIEAFDAGVFRKAIAAVGATVPVGSVIAVIADPSDDISKYESAAGSAAAEPSAPANAASTPPPAPAPAAQPVAQAPAPPPPASPAMPPGNPTPIESGRLRASPVARRIAQQRGVDITAVTGSGPDGRILRRDVENAQPSASMATAAGAAPSMRPQQPMGEDLVSQVDLNRTRQATARRMVQSKREAPHYYLTTDIDMTDAMEFRARANKMLGDAGHISVNDLIIFATVRTLQKHARFNSWWIDDALQLHSRINIGIAIALDDGLVAPALLDCGAKSLHEISVESRDLAERARKGLGLRPEEFSAGTFSVTNLGAYGIDTLVGIIVPPQTAILGVGTATERPAVRDGQIVARRIMTVALSADHRASDGAEGARFLQTLKQFLEEPALMLV